MYVLQADVFSAVKNGVTSREIRAAQRFHELIGNPGSTRDAADSYLLDQHAGILMQLATLFTVGPPKKQILIGAIGQLDRSYNYTLSGQDYGPLQYEWAKKEAGYLRALLAQAWRLTRRSSGSTTSIVEKLKDIWRKVLL